MAKPKARCCGSCGKVLNIVVTDPARQKLAQVCKQCETIHVGCMRQDKGYCVCAVCNFAFNPETIETHDISDIKNLEVCEDCRRMIELHAQEVDKGGIYFKCSTCGAFGVLKKSETTDKVRQQMGPEYTYPNIEYNGQLVYRPAGWTVSSINCPMCSKPSESVNLIKL